MKLPVQESRYLSKGFHVQGTLTKDKTRYGAAKRKAIFSFVFLENPDSGDNGLGSKRVYLA
jgi:hypothetical protein